MPANKDFKRLVRRRMQKTGEAYTSARAHLLRNRDPVATRAARSLMPADYPRLAGKSDALMKEKTGCTWERWVKALDRAQADTWPHSKIAKYVMQKYKIPGWWAQTVTVGYERIKGRREVGQRVDGSFETSKSRTFPVALNRLYRAFSDASTRARWLPDVDLTLRNSTRGKSMRAAWPDHTKVEVWLHEKGPGKSQVAVAHGKLPDRTSAQRMKQYWGERLDALKAVLVSK